MEFDEQKLISETYNSIRAFDPDLAMDSLKVVQDVIKHRNYWKPEKVKTMLLAESHVFTQDWENEIILQYPPSLGKFRLPANFVKLVYCLGYGEPLLAHEVQNNPGTWQYWKIFSYAASKQGNNSYKSVQKTKVIDSEARLNNKISTLESLRNNKVWLVDCSIVSLAGHDVKMTTNQKDYLLDFSFNNYISKLVSFVMPEHILIIGNRVGNIIERKLRIIDIPFNSIPQPQKRGDYQKELETIQEICNRP